MSTNPTLGVQGMPGMGPVQSQTSRKFLTNNSHIVRRGAKIDSASVDVGNPVANELRAGLVLVQVLTGPNAGKYVPKGHADCPDDGDIASAGILMETFSMLDKSRAAEDKMASLLIHGFVRESQLLWSGGDAGFKAAAKDVLPLVQFEPDVPQP